MPEGLKDLIVNGVSTVAVIYGIVEALKQARLLKAEYAPLVAIGIGTSCSVAAYFVPEMAGVVFLGAGLGVGASLGYAGFKKAATNSNDAQNPENRHLPGERM